MFSRFVRYRLVFDHIVWNFIYIYAAVIHSGEQQFFSSVVAILTGELTMLIIKKYGFKVCAISFNFCFNHYKVYIHLPCINTQQQTTSSFDITHVISSINCQTSRLYQRSANHCEGDCNFNIICLLRPYHSIHYCN